MGTTGLSPIQALIFIFIYAAGLSFFLFIFFKVSVVRIDNDAKTILFNRIITQQKELFSFAYFDSYFDTIAPSPKGGTYKVIYLIKGKKVEKRISGYLYSNIDEIQQSLFSIKYLGFQKKHSSTDIQSLLSD